MLAKDKAVVASPAVVAPWCTYHCKALHSLLYSSLLYLELARPECAHTCHSELIVCIHKSLLIIQSRPGQKSLLIVES
eukprot:1141273-Pelagomonas_calceolata.AAC.5